jgi:hypothetical protein
MEQVRRDLDALKQTSSARVFTAEFKTLAAIVNLLNNEKIFQYKEKLKGEVKTALAGHLLPGETFDSIVFKSIVLDQTLYDVDKAAKKAAKFKDSGSSQPPFCPPQQPRNNPSSSSSGPRNPGFSSGSRNNVAATSVPRTPSSTPYPPLSDAEKQYRDDNNLCRFCGGPHFKRDCEEFKKKLERDSKKGIPPRHPAPASSSYVNASANPVTVSHIISAAGKYDPQGH